MKRLIPLILVVGLSGCSALNTAGNAVSAAVNFTVPTQTTVDGLRASYDAAFLVPAAKYRQLGYCASGTIFTLALPCASKTVVAQLRQIDTDVGNEFNAVQNQINSGNTTGLSAAYTTLQGLVTNAENIASTLGVK